MAGALIIDKPEGLTSHDVVARVRRAAGTRRVGHAGTLDPFATGLLVCCIGTATRLVQFLVGLDKVYVATVRLGYATDTQDGTGNQITPIRSSAELGVEDLRRVLREFTGPQLQMPPMFSAKKVGGERLYRAAREGRRVERQAVRIVVYSMEMMEGDEAGLFANKDGTRDFCVQVRCSSGTYIRTLANDVGEKLGVGAHLVKLRRTQVGQFRLTDGLTLAKLETMERDELSAVMISPSDLLSHLPIVALDEEQRIRVTNGRALTLSDEMASTFEPGAQMLRLCDGNGRLVAVGNFDPAVRLISPRIVLAG